MTTPSVTLTDPSRATLVRRGQRLSYATAAYNGLEGALAVGFGLLAGSIALIGFGVDSVIELSASALALWRLGADAHPQRREAVERRTHRLIGASFLLLAAYVASDAVTALLRREVPAESPVGIAIATASLIVMPLLVRAKRRVATALGSAALRAEAQQTLLCTYLSAILLAGLGLNALLGWWWADPVAALGMVPIIVSEGVEGVRGRDPCGETCH